MHHRGGTVETVADGGALAKSVIYSAGGCSGRLRGEPLRLKPGAPIFRGPKLVNGKTF